MNNQPERENEEGMGFPNMMAAQTQHQAEVEVQMMMQQQFEQEGHQ